MLRGSLQAKSAKKKDDAADSARNTDLNKVASSLAQPNDYSPAVSPLRKSAESSYGRKGLAAPELELAPSDDYTILDNKHQLEIQQDASLSSR